MKGDVSAYRKVGHFQVSLERRIQIYSCKEQWVWEEKPSIVRDITDHMHASVPLQLPVLVSRSQEDKAHPVYIGQ